MSTRSRIPGSRWFDTKKSLEQEALIPPPSAWVKKPGWTIVGYVDYYDLTEQAPEHLRKTMVMTRVP